MDAVAKSTNVPLSVPITGMGAMTSAMKFPDPTEPGSRSTSGIFLDQFGRGDRDETMRSNDSSIIQALALLNNTIVTSRIKRATANSTVAKILASTTDPATIADQLYLATLSRHPSADEKTAAVNYLKGGTLGNRSEDLQFALINQLEFMFN